jgi:hypothetical protein
VCWPILKPFKRVSAIVLRGGYPKKPKQRGKSGAVWFVKTGQKPGNSVNIAPVAYCCLVRARFLAVPGASDLFFRVFGSFFGVFRLFS